MKRFSILLLIAFLLVGMAFGQERGRVRANAAPVTVEGSLKLDGGFVALQSGDTVYFVPRLMMLAGFIDGIREGANVSVEGYVTGNIIHPSKITVAGRSYEFNSGGRNFGLNRDGQNRGAGAERGRIESTRGKFGSNRGNFQRGGRNYSPRYGHRTGQFANCCRW